MDRAYQWPTTRGDCDTGAGPACFQDCLTCSTMSGLVDGPTAMPGTSERDDILERCDHEAGHFVVGVVLAQRHADFKFIPRYVSVLSRVGSGGRVAFMYAEEPPILQHALMCYAGAHAQVLCALMRHHSKSNTRPSQADVEAQLKRALPHAGADLELAEAHSKFETLDQVDGSVNSGSGQRNRGSDGHHCCAWLLLRRTRSRRGWGSLLLQAAPL